MNSASNHDERIAKLTFASVYPHYLAKAEKKGRTKEELHQVIEWLTGYNEESDWMRAYTASASLMTTISPPVAKTES